MINYCVFPSNTVSSLASFGYCFPHFLTNFNENIHTFQRSTIEIDSRGKKVKISSLKLHLFLLGEIYMNENKYLIFTSFFHSEVLGTTRTIFKRHHPGLLISPAMQNPRREFLIVY